MDTPAQNTFDLQPEATTLLDEYITARLQVLAQLSELEEKKEKLKKAIDEISHNVSGTVRVICRLNKLEGSWTPNDNGTQLVRVR